jgi:hypothetical protein
MAWWIACGSKGHGIRDIFVNAKKAVETEFTVRDQPLDMCHFVRVLQFWHVTFCQGVQEWHTYYTPFIPIIENFRLAYRLFPF